MTRGSGPGGTTFHFVNDGLEPALDLAREAAGDRDVRIAGGGATILEYVNAGLIDEFTIALSPVLFGSGSPVRGRGRESRGPAAGPGGADAASDAPDLRSPGALNLSDRAWHNALFTLMSRRTSQHPWHGRHVGGVHHQGRARLPRHRRIVDHPTGGQHS